MSKFKPKMYYKSIFDINYDKLKELNIKVLIFDSDNTIITYDEELPSDKVVNLIKKLSKDFKIFIASNNQMLRVKKIGDYLGVHGFYSVVKPTLKIRRLLIDKCVKKFDEVAIIGDQIITDIFMGNRLNMLTILVDPLGERDLKITYLKRYLEKKIMKRINIKRGEYYEKIL